MRSLPVHPVPSSAGHHTSLTISGLVRYPLLLDQAEFRALGHRALEAEFSCEEGWTVPRLRWRGVPVRTLVDLAQPLAEARFLRVGAGSYEITLDLASIPDALLCDEMDDTPLTRQHGAPWRLVIPGERCFTSVKWVERLEFTSEPGPPAGEQIARERLRQRETLVAPGAPAPAELLT